MRMPYPKSFLGLLITGFALVSAPLVIGGVELLDERDEGGVVVHGGDDPGSGGVGGGRPMAGAGDVVLR